MEYISNAFLLFIKKQKANISIMFAIILPVLIATFSLGIDGSRFLIKRARLADALSQGSFAVASTNTTLTSQQEIIDGKELVRSYVKYYLPYDTIAEDTLGVSVKIFSDDEADAKRIDYIANAQIIDEPLIEGLSKGLPGFKDEIIISADENNGIVRRDMGDINIESDIVFAVDFSASILDMTDDGTTHLEAIRRVVNDLKNDIIKNDSKSRIAIVPFDTAIPLKREDKNEAGGDRLGCVTPFKIKEPYNVDFSFWNNKFIGWKTKGIDITGHDAANSIAKFMDLKRYDYYSNIVYRTIGDSYKRYCNVNIFHNPSIAYDPRIAYNTDLWGNTGNKINSNPLSCEMDESISAVSIENLAEIEKNHEIMSSFYFPNLVLNMYPDFPTLEMVDFNGTLSDNFLFSEHGMEQNKFEAVFADRNMGNTFKGSCMSSFNIKSKTLTNFGVTIPEGHPWGNEAYYANNLKNIRQNAYVIGLSNNRNELDEFNKMNPVLGAGTDIVNGLLYSAHEVVKGDNVRKIIIIVSDGKTLGQTKKIEQRFFNSGLCKKITDGIVKNSPRTKEAKIYFISVINDSAVLSNWGNNCVGDDGVFVATDYGKLKDAISDMLSKDPAGLRFINKP